MAATSRKSIEKEDLEELQVEDKQKIKTLAIAAKKSETHIDQSSVVKSAVAPAKRRRI